MQFVIERTLFGLNMNEIGWIFIAISLTGISLLALGYLLHDIWLCDIERSCEDETEFQPEDI